MYDEMKEIFIKELNSEARNVLNLITEAEKERNEYLCNFSFDEINDFIN